MFLGGSGKRRGRPGQLQLLLPARVSPTGQVERPTGGGGGRAEQRSPELAPWDFWCQGPDGTSAGSHYWEAHGVRADTLPSGRGWNTPVITAGVRPQTSGLGQHRSKAGLRRRVRRGWDAPWW